MDRAKRSLKGMVSRPSSRVEIPGPVTVSIGSEEHRGWILSAVRSGALVAVSEEQKLGTRIVLRIPFAGENSFDLPATVVRLLPKKTPVQGFTNVLGLKFDKLTDAQNERLRVVLVSQPNKPDLPLEVAREILIADSGILGEAVTSELPDSPYLHFLGEISPFEKEAYAKRGPLQILARELILLRTQFGVFRAVLPLLQKDPGSSAPIFAPILTRLLERLDGAELRTEEAIIALDTEVEERSRKGLNDLSTRLDEPKIDLFEAVEKSLAQVEDPVWKQPLASILERLHRIRSARKQSDTDAGFHTPLVKKKGAAPSVQRKKRYPIFNLLMILTAVAVTGFVVWIVLLPRLRLAGYGIPLENVTATIEDGTLVVHTYRAGWKRLTPEEKKKTLAGIQTYLTEKKVRTSKIVAEDSKILAAILSGGNEEGRISFTQRVNE
ncbi:MAG: PilZ domain-containing protein [Pseudomonadota bacterium]